MISCQEAICFELFHNKNAILMGVIDVDKITAITTIIIPFLIVPKIMTISLAMLMVVIAVAFSKGVFVSSVLKTNKFQRS